MVEETIAGSAGSMDRVRSSDWDQRRHAPLVTGLVLQQAKIAKSNDPTREASPIHCISKQCVVF